MAPLPVIPGVFRCAVETKYLAVNVVNVIHVEAPPASTASDVATVVANAWGSTNSISLMQSVSILYEQVVVTKLDGTSAVGVDSFGAAAHKQGQTPGSLMPNSAACCIAIKTAQRGRRHRGRMFIGGIVNSNSNDQLTWITAFKNQALGSAIELAHQLQIGTPSCTLGVASYKDGGSFLNFDHFVINPRIATQRLRLF